MPDGWTLERDETPVSTYFESMWRNPRDGSTYLKVDVVDGETLAPATKAAQVRAATSRTPGYREVSFAPTRVDGRDAFRWVFRISGSTRVDTFVNACNRGYAILGSAPSGSFDRYAPTFRVATASLRPRC